MLSTLARTQKHVGQFVCEIDGHDANAWESIARAFESESGSDTSRAWRQEFSHLLLWRHGEAVAGARVAIGKLPGFRGHAVVRGGPLWRRPDVNPDPTIYRAALGALVQEYCIRRGHRLTIMPHAGSELHAQEVLALRLFGFASEMTGGYSFRTPSSPWRIMGVALGILLSVQRTIMGRYSRA